MLLLNHQELSRWPDIPFVYLCLSWNAKKEATVSRSSAESEYGALAAVHSSALPYFQLLNGVICKGLQIRSEAFKYGAYRGKAMNILYISPSKQGKE